MLLFGLGGIGGVYASILSLSKSVNVHVVARSNYESVKEKGFKFVSEKFGNHDITFDGGESILDLFSHFGPKSGRVEEDLSTRWSPGSDLSVVACSLALWGVLVGCELMSSLEEL